MIFHSWPIVVVFLLAVSVRAQEVVNETVSFNKLNTPELFQTHLSSKLDRCDATELSVFVASDDASLSVAAGWKLAINAHSVTNGQVQNRIEQFIGIVNARVSDLPEWWTDTIRSAKFSNSGVVLFNPPRKKPLTASQNQSFSGYCSGQITKNATSGAHEVLAGKKMISLDFINSTDVIEGFSDISLLIQDTDHYYCQHWPFVSSYPLYKVDSLNKTKRWNSKVWANGDFFESGSFWHHTELKVLNNSLIVFGAGSNCAYLEVFDCESGQCKFRFGTAYFIDDKPPNPNIRKEQ